MPLPKPRGRVTRINYTYLNDRSETDESGTRGPREPPITIALQLGETLRAFRGQVRQVEGSRGICGDAILSVHGGRMGVTVGDSVDRLVHGCYLLTDPYEPLCMSRCTRAS